MQLSEYCSSIKSTALMVSAISVRFTTTLEDTSALGFPDSFCCSLPRSARGRCTSYCEFSIPVWPDSSLDLLLPDTVNEAELAVAVETPTAGVVHSRRLRGFVEQIQRRIHSLAS